MNKKRIIYEIYFPAFCNNFKDLTDKLDYIIELEGITSIWLTPFYESPSTHGYNISNYKKIKREYGSMEDFEKFIEKAHKNNIEVFLDMVFCHTDYNHPLFLESITKDNNCYFWSDKQEDSRWRYCYGNQKWYYAPWDHTMPALNGNNPRVKAMIEDTVKFWLSKGVDGFRLDAVPFIEHHGVNGLEFWGWFRRMCESIKPDIYLVCEAWDEYQVSHAYGKVIGKSFNFEQSGWIKHHINSDEPLVIKNDVKHDVNFLDNHDMSRISHTFNGDLNKLKRSADILFSLGGDVCLYYGSEVGHGKDAFVHQGGEGDWKVRQPMPWYDVEIQRKDSNSLFNYYKKLIREYNKEE